VKNTPKNDKLFQQGKRSQLTSEGKKGEDGCRRGGRVGHKTGRQPRQGGDDDECQIRGGVVQGSVFWANTEKTLSRNDLKGTAGFNQDIREKEGNRKGGQEFKQKKRVIGISGSSIIQDGRVPTGNEGNQILEQGRHNKSTPSKGGKRNANRRPIILARV